MSSVHNVNECTVFQTSHISLSLHYGLEVTNKSCISDRLRIYVLYLATVIGLKHPGSRWNYLLWWETAIWPNLTFSLFFFRIWSMCISDNFAAALKSPKETLLSTKYISLDYFPMCIPCLHRVSMHELSYLSVKALHLLDNPEYSRRPVCFHVFKPSYY